MRARLSSLIVLSVMVLGVSIAGAETFPVQSGGFEFAPSFAFTRSSVSPTGGSTQISATHINLRADAARAFNNRFQLTAGLLAQHSARMGSARNSAGATFGGQYSFASQSGVLPFVSAAVGLVQYTGQERDRAWLLPMMRVGFRSMIGDARSLNVSAGFQHESNPKSARETSANVFDIGVGMSLFRAPR